MKDLRKLRFFVAIAEGMHLSRAAEALNISQSALSRQIQSLEDELGFRLFDRIGKRLTLTAEGEDLLPRAARLIEEANALTLRAESVARGRVGHLRLGATAQTIASLIAPALIDFRAGHPGIEITLAEAPNRALLEMVERGAVHLAIATPDDLASFEARPLFMASLLAYLPPDDPRHHLAQLPVEALVDAPLLLLRRGFMTRDLVDESFRTAGIRPRIVLESDSPHALVAMVSAGHGIAMLSSAAARGIHAFQPVPLTLAGAPIRRQVSAVWNPLRHRPAALPMLVEVLQATAQAGMLRPDMLTPGPRAGA
ncbi:LysR family transcriptional regulator [Bosea sp. TWI1241]|uniref:LysR family transcriptional regulator n=1 Tax=Bosea sp. TWI1241 TaxID=3148904 RepID=UPI003209EDEB